MDAPLLVALVAASVLVCWLALRLRRVRALAAALAQEGTRAADELRRLRERLTLAQHAGGLGAFDWLVDEGRVSVTPELETLIGLEPGSAETSTATLRARLHPDDVSTMEFLFRRCLTERREEIDYEMRVVRPDGRVQWLGVRGRFHFDAEGRPVRLVGVAIDVTERKEGERRLQAAHRRFVDVLASITDGFYIVDREWRVTYVNPAAARSFQQAPEDLVGRTLWEAAPGAADSEFENQYRRAMQERRPTCFETVSPLTHRWVEVHAYPFEDGLAVLFRDITPRKRMEQALRESEGRFRTMADSAPVHIWVDDAEQGCQFVNRAFLEFAGCGAAEALGDGWTAFVHPDDRDRFIEAYRDASDALQPFRDVVRFRRADGELRWMQSNGVPRLTPSGDFLGYLGCNVDITDVKRAEAEARSARAEAESASQAKDEFIAALSHELRTPLTPVLATAQMLDLDPDLAPEVREAAQLIRRNVELETRLIDDLLDLTRIRRGKVDLQFAPTDVHEVVRHVLEGCSADAEEKGLWLDVELAAERCHVQADPARLQQVLWNLLRNAVKFTPTGGRIAVRTTSTADGALLVEVEDSGIGIEPAVLPRLFNAFEQGSRSITRQFGGLGLGLAISRALIDANRGTLSVRSEGWGRGATFTVRLPLLADGAAARSTAPVAPVRAPEGPSVRVLVVDDHPDTAVLMARCLMRYGYLVRTAGSVGAALKVAGSETFDVIVSDIGLPDGTGLDLMQKLRERLPIRGVALSGYGMEEDVRRSHEAGFAAHLTKPVDLRRLLAVVERLARNDAPLEEPSP